MDEKKKRIIASVVGIFLGVGILAVVYGIVTSRHSGQEAYNIMRNMSMVACWGVVGVCLIINLIKKKKGNDDENK